MNDPMPQAVGGKKGLPVYWMAAAIMLALIVWMLITASQYATVKPGHGSMSNMNPPMQATVTMSGDMPGMNH